MIDELLLEAKGARLFPVLADVSKEGRITSVFLSILTVVPEFRMQLLQSLGKKTSASAKVEAYTEIPFKTKVAKASARTKSGLRPDGLLVVSSRGKRWTALIEAKVGNSQIDEQQLADYIEIAKEQKIDCVVTISNQFVADPTHHPCKYNPRKNIPVFHWSWSYVKTKVSLLREVGIDDHEQHFLLDEFYWLLSDPKAGVKDFTQMGESWRPLCQKISTLSPTARISLKDSDAANVVSDWHQECKDMVLKLSESTKTEASLKLAVKHRSNSQQRFDDDIRVLCEKNQLVCTITAPKLEFPIETCVDLRSGVVSHSIRFSASDHRKSITRINWLLRQLSEVISEEVYICCLTKGRGRQASYPLASFKNNLDELIEESIGAAEVTSFIVSTRVELGTGGISQPRKIIDVLEKSLERHYEQVVQNIRPWVSKPSPILRDTIAEDVSAKEELST